MARKKRQIKRGDTIKLIVKSNELVEARYMFDIWESRFFHTLVAMINKEDEDEKVYRVWFKDTKKIFKLRSNQSYGFLREAAKSLNRKPVYVGWQKDEFRRGREYNLFEFVDYLEAGQGGPGAKQQEYVDIKIHAQMRPFLLYVQKNFDPVQTRYTSYDLRNIKKLQPYSTRMYELFKQFEYKGYRVLDIEELKERFLITKEYPRYSTLYQRVIVPSIKAINKHTDITIPLDEIEKIKKGRRVAAIRCVINSKTSKEVAALRGEQLFGQAAKAIRPQDHELFKEFEAIVVKSFGVTPSVFSKMLHSGRYHKQSIQQAINVTRKAKYNQEIKKSVSGFFIKALKEGFTDIKEEAKKKKQSTLAKQKKVAILEQELMDCQNKYATEVNHKVKALAAQDPTLANQAIEAIKTNLFFKSMITKKEQILERSLQIEDYRQDKQLRDLVVRAIIELKNKHFSQIISVYESKIQALEKALKVLKE